MHRVIFQPYYIWALELSGQLLFQVEALLFFSTSCSAGHVLDGEAHQLVEHLWVCGDRSISAFSSDFHLEKVDDTEILHTYFLFSVLVDDKNCEEYSSKKDSISNFQILSPRIPV
ncbi:hypothetical protein ACTXT7_012832 [Hymenolepis weldensis]